MDVGCGVFLDPPDSLACVAEITGYADSSARLPNELRRVGLRQGLVEWDGLIVPIFLKRLRLRVDRSSATRQEVESITSRMVTRMSRSRRHLVLAVCVAVALATCFLTDDERAEFTSRVIAAPHTVSSVEHPYDADWPDVRLMLAHKCNACHRPGLEQTDLTSWETIVGTQHVLAASLVVPGKPESSPLWQYVTWNVSEDPVSDRPSEPLMPPEQAEWLTAGQLETLARWITNGALEYRLPDTCSTAPLMEIDFPSAKECSICHPKQFEEWSRSMHAYAQHSPVFEAFNLTLQERTSGTLGTFCTRCHTPAGTALGENGQRRNVNRSRLSMEGVTCVSCHRVDKSYYKASTRRHIVPGNLADGCMYGPFADAVSPDENAHGAAQRVSIRSSAFCGSCHDVFSPEGIRLEEAFSEWQNSPAAKNEHTCQHCHMGPVQGQPFRECERPVGRAATVPGVDPKMIPLRPLSDHTFAGPDYSLLPDTEFPHKLDWMYEADYRRTEMLTRHQQVTLDQLRRKNRKQLSIARDKRYELLQNAAKIHVDAPGAASCGDRIAVQVDIQSLVSGHNFPTGFTEERQLWVSVELCDSIGRSVFTTGDFDHNGDLRDEHSHAVIARHVDRDRHLLNFQSKFVGLATRGTERPLILSVNRQLAPLNIFRPAPEPTAAFGRPSTFRISKGSIAPLSTVSRSYAIRLPEQAGDYCLRVRLNYRHLPPHLMDEIGTPHLKPLLETVNIDQHDSVIQVMQGAGRRLLR
ncbi:MAG: multiheme c-type cytochrome [Planctomycetota bacterium]|nr:multiheme c-type cytochrome [Planctomycetota bacterium]